MAVKSIGNMREVVVFKQNSPTAQGAGYVDQYSTLLTTRGQLINRGGNRSLAYGEISDGSSWTLRVRFQTALAAGIRSDMKIEISGVTYTFSSYRLIDQRKQIYEFDIHAEAN